MKNKLKYYIAKNKNNFIIRFLASLALKFISAFKNSNYDFYTNGEAWVLDNIKNTSKSIIFDVGANEGDWAITCNSMFPSSQIHCFELANPTFKLLEKNTSHLESLILNDFGLSDKNERISFLYNPKKNKTTSFIYNNQINKDFGYIEGNLKRGDDYVEELNIDQIYFLKIDAEGSENLILSGFERSLRNGKISIIQFEYGRANIVSGFLLKDFYNYLTPFGFRIGKIFPNSIEFKEYDYLDEDFIGPNFLAVHQREHDLINILSKKN